MSNRNNFEHIPQEKFRFVQMDERLHDKKLETKARSFFQDAMLRFSKNKSSVIAAWILLFLLLSFLAFYAFPLTAFFENSVFGTLKNALAISLRHLPSSLLVLVINLFPAAVLYFSVEIFVQMLIAFLFILPGIQSFWVTGILRRVFANYVSE